VDESEKDWHPGSNNQVLDLVHPSLFCLIYGMSRCIHLTGSSEEQKFMEWIENHKCYYDEQFITSGETIQTPESEKRSDNDYSKSNKYQWLPSEVTVSSNGKAKFETYINNLHPEWHRKLYNPIERIFEKFVPLFNRVPTDVVNPRKNRIHVNAYSWYDHLNKPEDDDDYEEFYESRVPKQPEIPNFVEPRISARIDLCGRRLQVIVKLANIVLTPENPKYDGGAWHIEGMLNEKIVASGIYSSDNITESLLGFREAVNEPEYEQNDDRGVRNIYGLGNEEPLVQTRGFVTCQENRCIAFPNTMQHRVAPFQLEDETKPGIRKILVFFLVDPNERVLSTLHVPTFLVSASISENYGKDTTC
jgi:hypothetical protein